MHPFIRKLRHGSCLTQHDQEALSGLAHTTRRARARSEILSAGDASSFLPLIVEGWACRFRLLEDGKRQITALLLPGDLCEPYGVLSRFIYSSLGALTPVVFSRVSLEAIRAAAKSSAAIEEALWWDLLGSTAMDRERVVSLGRRSAVERLGHLFCELHVRLQMVGLVSNHAYELPLTQTDLADVLGLSTVHINRSLQELRTMGLISLRARALTIHHLERLQAFSYFDADYLQPRARA